MYNRKGFIPLSLNSAVKLVDFKQCRCCQYYHLRESSRTNYEYITNVVAWLRVFVCAFMKRYRWCVGMCVCSTRGYASILNQIESSVHALNCNIHLLLKLSIFWMFIFYTRREHGLSLRALYLLLLNQTADGVDRESCLALRPAYARSTRLHSVTSLNCYVFMRTHWNGPGLTAVGCDILYSTVCLCVLLTPRSSPAIYTPRVLFAYRSPAMSPVENTKKVLLCSSGNNAAARRFRMPQQRARWN